MTILFDAKERGFASKFRFEVERSGDEKLYQQILDPLHGKLLDSSARGKKNESKRGLLDASFSPRTKREFQDEPVFLIIPREGHHLSW